MSLWAAVAELGARGVPIRLLAFNNCFNTDEDALIDSCCLFAAGPIAAIRLCYTPACFGEPEPAERAEGWGWVRQKDGNVWEPPTIDKPNTAKHKLNAYTITSYLPKDPRLRKDSQ